jgi:hypothetical protein
MWSAGNKCRCDLSARLGELSVKLSALRNAFESVQDLVDLPGLRLWQAELARVITTNLAAELRRCFSALGSVYPCEAGHALHSSAASLRCKTNPSTVLLTKTPQFLMLSGKKASAERPCAGTKIVVPATLDGEFGGTPFKGFRQPPDAFNREHLFSEPDGPY